MAINVYFNFDGNTREAVEFYADVFGVPVGQIMTFGQAPQDPNYPLPEEAKDLIMHARIEVAGTRLMFSDTFPGMPFVKGNNVTLALVLKDKEAVESAFHKLKVGGNITMELQETFWSPMYGALEDKFGIQWQFNVETEDNPA
ncbi:VOC family protein [Paenibacillus koleovorans]|uniref:VOC family protein n=1 Tax=Paenibacillus koleovorans TaxID=121608 RepID=UPI000FD862E8|nr:VOC family protein [Paenibacillus koleovorans]